MIQVQLLGREYYQTSFGEKFLVLAPLGLHISTGIAKRLLSRPRTKSPRPLSTLLSLTAYGAVMFYPIHFITHRLNPSNPSPPIFSATSELDFEFVKLGLQTWPWRSWILYAGLVGCVALHAAEGMTLIGNMWAKDTWALVRTSKQTRRVAAGLSILPVLTGLWFVAQEPLMTFSSLARRFEAAFTQSLLYRF